MADVYKLKCEEYETPPRPEFAKIFESVDAAKTFSISVQGNCVGMFTKRLDDVEVIAMVQTIMSSGLDNLEHLDLRYHQIGDAGATALSLLFQVRGRVYSFLMTYSILHRYRFTADSSPIFHLKDAGDYRCILKSLYLQGNDITEVGCAKLSMNLVFNTTILEVNLNGNPLGNEGGMAVAQMLSKNRTLKKLDIGNTELGTESIIALATVLKSNNVLTSLNIENPRLYSKQEESTHQLAKMIQVNRTLEELNMGKHAIRDHGARILAQSLLDNTSLTSINLRCNEIGIGGGEALAALLIKGCSVVDLSLASNRIADDGAFAFGAALKSEKAQESLLRLDLSKNGICDDGLVAIAAGMENNNNLAQLNLWVSCSRLFRLGFSTLVLIPASLSRATSSSSHPHENSTSFFLRGSSTQAWRQISARMWWTVRSSSPQSIRSRYTTERCTGLD
jgi:Ran GTPase-activating protein (RanGAP) involved in mRNA processing and transport